MKKGAAAGAASVVAVIFLVSFFLLLIFINASPAQSQAPPASSAPEARCYDTGAFSISNLDNRASSVSVKKSGGPSYAVTGAWRGMSNGLFKFTSEDMAVVDVSGGYYSITIGKKSYGVTCPAFKFSCKLINLSINSCYKRNSTFFGKYTAYSFRYDKKNEFRFEKPFMLTYEAVSEIGGKKRELTHSPKIVSPEFEIVNISRSRRVGSNTYTLRWQTPLNVSRLIISYGDCENAKYTFYDSFQCTERPSCTTDAQCLQTERCDDGFCIPISCHSCQYLANHTCIDYDCCTDDDCDTGYLCNGRRCQPVVCEFTEHSVGHGCESLECSDDEYVYNQTCSKLNCEKGQVATSHICKDVVCSDDQTVDLETNSCKKLSCGFLKKAKNHQCVSIFSLWFGKK